MILPGLTSRGDYQEDFKMDKARFQKIARYENRVGSNIDPVSLQAAILDACFNKCPMCDHPSREQHTIRADRWIKFLKDHPEIESVCYSGGDTMAHPELNDIIGAHITLNKAFGFITAGYVPPKIDLELLAKARWVRVSLDTIDPDVYAKVRGGIPLARVLESLERMREANVNVEMTLTVGLDSVKTFERTLYYLWANEYNCDAHPQYGMTFDDLGISENLLYKWQNDFEDKRLTFAPFEHGGSENYMCSAVYYQSFIDSKGDIYPCCIMAGDTSDKPVMVPLGNIDDWERYLSNRRLFSIQSPQARPAECCSCPERFALINKHCASQSDTNSFF